MLQIDKEGANIERVKQEMSENGLLPEEWGGETPMVAVRLTVAMHLMGVCHAFHALATLSPAGDFLWTVSVVAGIGVLHKFDSAALGSRSHLRPGLMGGSPPRADQRQEGRRGG